MLEYRLPDLMKHREYIRNMYPDDAAKIRDDIKSHLNTVVAALDDAIENQIESFCDICASAGYGYMSLPQGWGWLGGGTLMCDKCVARWTEKFGEAPVLNTKGEIVYDDSSVSEDSAHRGQAAFDFI